MRISPRATVVALVTALACSLTAGAVAASAKPQSKSAPATTVKQEKAQNTALKSLAAGLKTTNANVAKDKTTLTGVSTALTALQATVTAAVSTATSALTQLQSGLTALSKAVQDTTTGLPGLNNARPLIGAVVSNAAVTGSEFTLVAHANLAGNGGYILSFKNGAGAPTDVSQRVYEVTSPNATQLGTTFAAANCSNPLVSPTCGVVNSGPDDKATDVLVVTTGDNKDFQIAAISG